MLNIHLVKQVLFLHISSACFTLLKSFKALKWSDEWLHPECVARAQVGSLNQNIEQITILSSGFHGICSFTLFF